MTSQHDDDRMALEHAIEHTGHLLPAQGPIRTFIHHNTLHALQHMPFHQAIAVGTQTYGAQGYWSEDRYRALYGEGRINAADLDEALQAWRSRDATRAPDTAAALVSQSEIERLALVHAIRSISTAHAHWEISNKGALSRVRADASADAKRRVIEGGSAYHKQGSDGEREALAVAALWDACQNLDYHASAEKISPTAQRATHREWILKMTGEDINSLVHPHLIRYVSAYLDEGTARWHLPQRALGFYRAWRQLLLDSESAPLPYWLRGLCRELRQHEYNHWQAIDVVLHALRELHVSRDEWDHYIQNTSLQLAGWAGMMHRLQTHSFDRSPDAPPASLIDFLAVRLIYERHALQDVSQRYGIHIDHVKRRSATYSPDPLQHRYALDAQWRLFQLCQVAGVGADQIAQATPQRKGECLRHLDTLDELTRQRIWCEAYEAHYRSDVLHGVAINASRYQNWISKAPNSRRGPAQPTCQIMFCIDDREESIRRHLEELAPTTETFGVAGFFGFAIAYQGLDDSSAKDLCPVVVEPQHAIHEHAHEDDVDLAHGRTQRRRHWARVTHAFHGGSRGLFGAALLMPLVGLLSLFPMASRLFLPRATARLRRAMTAQFFPAPRTRLTTQKKPEEATEHPTIAAVQAATVGTKHLGFTLQEMIQRAAGTLENVGLVSHFAPWVVLLGHGSQSVNNPHRSAYDCGACGGSHGGPNARLFAEICNRADVRAGLLERGIAIPETTVFIGGMHDTCTDAITLYDVESLTPERRVAFSDIENLLQQARELSAHERCRRLESAPLSLTPYRALLHVEGRAHDLSQARPELGHVTNAACVIGRRALTRGLFLDRRSFLVSYDPSIDPQGAILERTLVAVGPVGAGINLEYYFSCVDNQRYGCGTKLPHNLSCLLGVMDGSLSDLRTGLPKQMIEIHEPMRLLTVCDAKPSTLLAIVERRPDVAELVLNRWIQIVAVDPEDGAIWYLSENGFERWNPSLHHAISHVKSSQQWYRNQRDFLPPALIDDPLAA